MTLISAGDIVNGLVTSSSSESSSDDVSGMRSGGVRFETVVSERVFVGKDESARLASAVMRDAGSIM